ncbi:MAG: DUF3791 domain-containing protein [Planctomycetaceae bacterium]|nr:DUF3791 domain-containing protein [Planctomycetaceae bacterium]
MEFVSFCIEMYANQYSVSGADVARKFDEAGVLDYLLDNYEALHTQGWRFILPLINDYMNNQKSEMK